MCLELEKGTRIKIRSSNPSLIIPLMLKTSQICFWWKLFDVSFHKKIFGEAEDDRNSPPSWKKASIFQKLHQKVCSQKLTIKELRRQFVKSFTKESQKVVMKIEEMVDVLKKNHKFCAICIFFFNTKGQLFSEWIYEDKTSPKKRTKNCKDFCPHSQGRNPCNFLFVFWEKFYLHKFILKLTDL